MYINNDLESKQFVVALQFEKDPTAYLGITVPNFPNFFLLFGPNTVVAHNSALFMIECQVNYVMKCLKEVIQSGESGPILYVAWNSRYLSIVLLIGIVFFCLKI